MKIEIIDAGHGDCILVTCAEVLILIDSGPKSFKIRNHVIEKLKSLLNGKAIDIAIVTHNDDDHIGGFKYILDSGILIKKFIFNSLKYVSKILKVKRENKQISYQQDIDLQNLLQVNKIDVLALNTSEQDVLIGADLRIIPLTPNPSVLLAMHDDAIRKNKQISRLNKSELSIAECMENIIKGQDYFEADRSITNKSSLSLIIEYIGDRYLFLGDSHADDVIFSLIERQANNFKAVKISHHGSEKNTSSELISLIGKTEYILCGDKSSQANPSRMTISRILCFDSTPKIHLSADNIELRKMFDECRSNGFNVEVTYPTDKVNRVIYE